MRNAVVSFAFVASCSSAPIAGGSAPDSSAPLERSTMPDASTDAAAFASTDAGTTNGANADAPARDAAVLDAAGVRRLTTPSQHRASSAACSVDAGVVVASAPCVVEADCDDASPSRPYRPYCFHGQCSTADCSTDTDCVGAGPCAVPGDYSRAVGLVLQAQDCICVGGNCQVDSDCGPGGFCSPSVGYCQSLAGFYCHTKADTCGNSADCNTANAEFCIYDAAIGHWACAQAVCSG